MWASISLMSMFRPAFVALISGRTTSPGAMRRNRMPMRIEMRTRTPDAMAEIHSPTGKKRAKK